YRERHSAAHYDRTLHLDPELLLEFVTATQPEVWRDLERQHGASAVNKFIRRLTREVERRGTLDVLRRGIKDSGCHFQLAYFEPATTLNPDHWARYRKNILSVIRQCHYSTAHPEWSLDLVICLNGLPIFTFELKHKLTGQTVADARAQYAKQRDPREPLFQFRRCLAHFAVDDDEVWLTTRLEGESTRFLPFNRGENGGAGNPPNPNGYASAYLWEEVLSPSSVLELVGSFIHVENGDQPKRMIFPRYHQRDAVRALVAHARAHGSGQHYLIQHSAGSGKSNTIAWLAHRLASLHNAHNKRVFDSVIVITDRRVLDRQLQNTVQQFAQVAGVVKAITEDSEQLAEALNQGRDIIVTTLQKFPFVLDKVKAQPKRTYAVIVDEAHASQTGESSKHLRAVLRASSLEEAAQHDSAAEASEPSSEDLINQSIAARERQPNISFFAFTATPKAKTLELFGVQQPDGHFRPFHLYTMRQAIEEGFILDVLQNYTTYETYFNLLKKAEDDPRIEKSKAFSLLKRFVNLHSFTIGRKTAIMVEHFWEIVRHKIPDAQGVGQAKAMVVTASRLHAVRYKQAFDAYLKQRGYPIKALVAFSGTVSDHGLDYTEAGMNGFPESQTAEKFKDPEYRFLIVAEKFQTGFDQPLLHTMYVDKKLEGVHAVQTLSRLNRVHPGKTDVLVLDFVNRAQDIEAAFAPYYEATLLSASSDPNRLYDLQTELEQFYVFTPQEVEQIADLFLRKGERAEKLQPIIRSVVAKYEYLSAEERQRFKHFLRSYVNMYAFLSQVMTFRDPSLERLYLFARLLLRALPPDRTRTSLAVGELVDLESYRLQQSSSGRLRLSKGEPLQPFGELELHELTDPEKAALSQIIKEINERFGTEFTEADRVFFAELKTRLASNEVLQSSARTNSPESVRLLHDALFDRVLQSMVESNFEMFKRISDDEAFGRAVREKIFALVYRELLKQIGDIDRSAQLQL
ncbi:MAG: DEAD/DEAH box helicase family protein, partial [Anaerolineae bacterium]|nr:DEAD/DEAH box helicase family protein [Thermoflexales bacterium]MDW8396305.1 DEAD/DEAH box helicase family protein [Anaerolineae bacterium]